MGEWISIKDRPPREGQFVLVVFPNGEMVVACIYAIDEDVMYWRAQTDMGWESDMDFAPVYWMPLPKPPKEG